LKVSHLRTLLPNGLSLARLLIGLSFPWLPAGWRLPAVVIGALTDFLDGQVSRRLDASSSLGRVLDPLADKVFLLGIIVTLIWEGAVEIWELGLIGLRDIVVMIGVVWIGYRHGWAVLPQLQSRLLGKAATLLQFLFLVLLILKIDALHWPMLVVTTGASGAAAVDYIRAYLQWRSGYQKVASSQEIR
jgi:cardiolipin synthase